MQRLSREEIVLKYKALLSNRTKECQRLDSGKNTLGTKQHYLIAIIQRNFSFGKLIKQLLNHFIGYCGSISDYNFGCLNSTFAGESFVYECQSIVPSK